MLKRCFAALLLLLLASAVASAQTPTPDHWTAIRAGRLFDTKSEKLVSNQVVLIRGDRIAEVGPADRVKVPAGAEVVDLSHATVLPGTPTFLGTDPIWKPNFCTIPTNTGH